LRNKVSPAYYLCNRYASTFQATFSSQADT
jgi:hypothetical protein